MKFTITQLSSRKGETDGRSWLMLSFINQQDGQKYSCFQTRPYTDNFHEGYEFEAEVTTKPNPKGGLYRNIVWPKQDARNGNILLSQPQLKPSDQLNRIEKKIDFILQSSGFTDPQIMSKRDKQEMGIPELPYSDSPPPTSDDEPGTPF